MFTILLYLKSSVKPKELSNKNEKQERQTEIKNKKQKTYDCERRQIIKITKCGAVIRLGFPGVRSITFLNDTRRQFLSF